ncbi:hypothetical protein [Paracidovorax konjaci]|uniref:Tir chaperone protein (CesT) family protein n=1 Tax=Paracidovorax konjaci TaxID=32040 RepID=A0A1I1V4I5_9BURK|nr:hypothetical protein [Paracidovorax konjaci]SFD77941.1 hypothetical protein SAMN04489710_10646 [Paracidovorax konjaci]
MTTTPEIAEAASTPRLHLSPTRRACLEAAVRLMGADDASVRAFSEQGMVMADGILLGVSSLSERDDGRLLATALVRRPASVSEARWAEALLLANGQAILLANWAFSLEEGGDAVLLLPLDADLHDPRMLSANFDGMLSLCAAVAAGAEAVAQAAHPQEAAA